MQIAITGLEFQIDLIEGGAILVTAEHEGATYGPYVTSDKYLNSVQAAIEALIVAKDGQEAPKDGQNVSLGV